MKEKEVPPGTVEKKPVVDRNRDLGKRIAVARTFIKRPAYVGAAPVAEPAKNIFDETSEPTPKADKRREMILAAGLIVFCALFTLLGGLGGYDPTDTIAVSGYELPKRLLYWGFVIGLSAVAGFVLLVFAVNPPQNRAHFKNNANAWSWLIMGLLGIPAYCVLAVLLAAFARVPLALAHFLSALAVLFYEYLNAKLYAYGRIDDKRIAWEIYRFALVGIVATVCDFLVTTTVRSALQATPLAANDTAITAIAVTLGFGIGVIVNYVCSVYIVYKASRKSNAKTFGGMVLFVLLSAVGLGIGIGMESLFYDYLGWAYLGVFAFRTAVVLVWNYLSRKFFIFR